MPDTAARLPPKVEYVRKLKLQENSCGDFHVAVHGGTDALVTRDEIERLTCVLVYRSEQVHECTVIYFSRNNLRINKSRRLRWKAQIT